MTLVHSYTNWIAFYIKQLFRLRGRDLMHGFEGWRWYDSHIMTLTKRQNDNFSVNI